LCGSNTAGAANENLEKGLRATEALYFWLGGFSSDEQFPVSGPGGPSFDRNTSTNPGGEVLESRLRRYEFDLTRLGPRKNDGTFDEAPSGSGRFLWYSVDLNSDGDVNDAGETRRINFWRYTPKGSTQPLVYFDTSRRKPGQYDLWAADPNPPAQAPWIVAFKQLREGRTKVTVPADIVYVNQGKFQVLHAGLDDDWGSDSFKSMHTQNGLNTTLYPEGPFIGPIADTLTNFTDGTIEDATQE
jgi:hypothetical protein